MAQDYESVKSLISDNINLDAYDENGHTALMKATLMRDPVMVDILIQGGSKIFYPSLNDTKIDAYSKVHPSDTESLEIFKKERKRLYDGFEELMADQKLTEAIQYIQTNHLPVNTDLPSGKSSLIDMSLESAQTAEDSPGKFAKFIVTRALAEGLTLSEIQKDLTRLSSIIKDTILFDFLVSEFKKHGIKSDLNAISADDTTDIPWMTDKLRAFNKHSMAIDFDKSNLQIINLLVSSNTTTAFLNSSKTIITETITNPAPIAERAQFLSELLKKYIEKAKTNSEFLRFANSALEIWKAKDLPASGYDFDSTMTSLVSAIEGKNFDIDEIKTLSERLRGFLSNNDSQSAQSFKIVITGNFTEEQQAELTKIMLNTVENIPSGITGEALRANNVKIFKLLLEDPTKSQGTNQSEAILIAIESLDNPFSILEALKALDERKIAFDNEYGISALNKSLERFWSNGDNHPVVLFLLEDKPEIVKSMNDDESSALVKGQLNHIRKSGKNGLLELNLIVKAMNPVSKPVMIERDSLRYLPVPLKISIAWDFIDIVINATHDHNIDYSTWLEVLPTILEKFPKDTFSLYQTSDRENFSPDKYPTQNALSLALMMYSGEDVLEKLRFGIKTMSQSRKALDVKEKEFSWTPFVESKYFQKNLLYSNIWKIVIPHFINSGNFNISLKDNDSSLKMLSIVVVDQMYDTFPGLLSAMNDLKLDAPLNEFSCSSTDSLDDRMDRPMANASLYFLLHPIYRRTCGEDKDISDSDLEFLKKYIGNILIEPDFDIVTEINNINSTSHTGPAGSDGKHVTEVPCDSFYDWQNTPFSDGYSVLGVRQKLISSDDITEILNDNKHYQRLAGKTCTTHTHSKKIQALLYRKYLNAFFNCSSEKGLIKLVNFFQSIDSKYKLSPTTDGDVNIGMCIW